MGREGLPGTPSLMFRTGYRVISVCAAIGAGVSEAKRHFRRYQDPIAWSGTPMLDVLGSCLHQQRAFLGCKPFLAQPLLAGDVSGPSPCWKWGYFPAWAKEKGLKPEKSNLFIAFSMGK